MEGILEEIGKTLDEKLAPITNRLGTIEHSHSNLSEVEKIKDLETKWEQKEIKQQLLEKEINEVKLENKKLMWVFHHTTKAPDYGVLGGRLQKFA